MNNKKLLEHKIILLRMNNIVNNNFKCLKIFIGKHQRKNKAY